MLLMIIGAVLALIVCTVANGTAGIDDKFHPWSSVITNGLGAAVSCGLIFGVAAAVIYLAK